MAKRVTKPKKDAKAESKKDKMDDPLLPKKSLFRIDEVARYFSVSDRCIRLWIDHGHLKKEKVVGTIRISRESILRCRFRGMASNPLL